MDFEALKTPKLLKPFNRYNTFENKIYIQLNHLNDNRPKLGVALNMLNEFGFSIVENYSPA